MNVREQRLALALAAMVLAGCGWIVYLQMIKWKNDVAKREYSLSLRKVEAEELMKQKDFWVTRSAWLQQKQPVFKSRKEADNFLYELMQKSAREAAVSLAPPQQQQLEEQPGLKGAGVMVEITGELEKVLRWLYKIQTVDSFITVKGMTLKPDAEDLTKVHLTDVHIQKWYRDDGSTTTSPVVTPAPGAPATPATISPPPPAPVGTPPPAGTPASDPVPPTTAPAAKPASSTPSDPTPPSATDLAPPEKV